MSNKTYLILTLTLFLCFCCVNQLFPVEVKKVEVNHFSEFQKGTFSGTALDSTGSLFLGPKIKEISGPEKEYYLGLAAAQNGNIYVGTGHNGAVYEISAPAAAGTGENTVKEIAVFTELDVFALSVKSSGEILAGTSPDGKVYKIDKKKEKDKAVEEFFDPEEKFIWDIKEDKTGNIIVATGNAGAIYRVSKEGSAAKVFTPEDTHIISLYITRSGSILAGSGDRGILYQIDNTKARVLFDSPFEEIRGICEDNDGNIFFSATRGIKQQNVLNNVEVEVFLEKKKKKKEEEEVIPLEKSIVYCRRTNGIVEKVWGSRTEYVYAICGDPKGGSVLVGTGNAGRVYRVNKEGNFSIIYESDAAQVFKLVPTLRGFTLITNNTAAVTGIENTLNNQGTYFSSIYDLGIQSKLGKIYWEAETAPDTGVSLSIRAGNSNVPDATWSKWSAPFTNNQDADINISDIRYFQVKALLNSSNPTASPRLNNYRAYYIQSNLKPKLRNIEIKKQEKKKKPPTRVTVLSGYAGAARVTGDKPEHPANHYLVLRWEARDPNKDKLKYNLFLKRTTDNNWLLFKEDITTANITLDTRLFEDGQYLLKVAADDSLANPPDISETAILVSSPFLIDSTAPEITNFSVTARRVAFTVNDKTSLVAGVLYSYDGELWFPVFPVDMVTDSKTETFDFILKDMDVNKNRYIFIKVMDEFDNSKVFQKEL